MCELGLYQFASDYIRLWVLKKYGGIYLDCDVEILKPFDDTFLNEKTILCGNKFIVAGAILGFEPNHPLLNIILDKYNTFKDKNDIEVMELVITPLILQYEDKTMYDVEMFHPTYDSYRKRYRVKDNTYTIHHSIMSWKNKLDDIKQDNDIQFDTK